jgi:flagellar motor switch protein FliN/FliY
MAETEQAEQQQAENSSAQTEVREAQFPEASDSGAAPGEENLDILLDINMPITVNLGKTTVPFKRLLQLGPGSVLELDKAVGEPAELYVQDIQFASGDVVVADGCFAVRIKEVLGIDSPDRAASKQRENKAKE